MVIFRYFYPDSITNRLCFLSNMMDKTGHKMQNCIIEPKRTFSVENLTKRLWLVLLVVLNKNQSSVLISIQNQYVSVCVCVSACVHVFYKI